MKKGTGWKLGAIASAGTLTIVTASLAGVGGIALNMAGEVLPVKPRDLKEKQINYIALGDSYTSGYNAFMGEDYVSFADFFAADLKREDRLGSYKNFSKKSNLIFDIMNQSVLAGDVREALLNADVITITAGANDLVHLLEIAGMALPSLHKSHEYGEVIDENINSGYPDGYDQKVSDAVMDLAHKIATQDFSGMMMVDETIYKDLYLAVTLNLTLLTTEIAKLAPGAQIILLSPMYPLPYLPDSMLESPIPGNDGMSFHEIYNKLMDTYDNIAKLNPAVKHINMGEIDEFENNNEKVTIDGMEVYRKQPHLADVNPSTYGHELIGNGLFRMMAPQLGIDYDKDNLAHGHKAEFNDGEMLVPRFNADGTPKMDLRGRQMTEKKVVDMPNNVEGAYITTIPGQYQAGYKNLPAGLRQKQNANGDYLYWHNPTGGNFNEDHAVLTPLGTPEVNLKELEKTDPNLNTNEYWPIIIATEAGDTESHRIYKWDKTRVGQPINPITMDPEVTFSPEYIDELAQDIYLNDTTAVNNSKGVATTVSALAKDYTSTFMFDVTKDLINTLKTKTDITSFLASGMPKIINQIRDMGSDDQYFAVNTFLNSTATSAGVNIPEHKVFSIIKQGKEIKPFDIDITEITKEFQADGAAADLMGILQLMLLSATPEEYRTINELVDSLILDQNEQQQVETALTANAGMVFRGNDTHIGALDVTTINNAKNIFDLNLMMTMTVVRELMEDNNGQGSSGFGTVFGTNKFQNEAGVLAEASPYYFWNNELFASAQTSVTAIIQKYGITRSRQIFKDFGVNVSDSEGQIDIDKYFDELLVAFDNNGLPFNIDQDKAARAKMIDGHGGVKPEFHTVERMAKAMQANLGSLENPNGRTYALLASVN